MKNHLNHICRYPTFEKPEYMATVPEDTVPGILVEQVKATDADFGVNAEITYRIQQGIHRSTLEVLE